MSHESDPWDRDESPSVDDRLWPGERPFTEFGQWGYGSLDLRVFDQDTVWCNIAGRALKVTHMDRTTGERAGIPARQTPPTSTS